MDRRRTTFSGFTKSEVQKMERFLKDKDKQPFDMAFCKKLAGAFNKSKARAGKPAVKWTEVQNWFETQPQVGESEEGEESEEVFRAVREACSLKGKKGKNIPEIKFEALSSKDSAWYDVDHFVENRHLDSPNKDLAEVLVRFETFNKDQDEWVKVKNAVRKRSIALEASQCHLVEVGTRALHYLKEKEAARYFDVEILGIEKKKHSAKTCSCNFTIRYLHDSTEKNVKLGGLYFRPSILGS